MQCCLQICLAALISVKYLTRPRIQGVAIKKITFENNSVIQLWISVNNGHINYCL